jgi:hypothetical protein
MVSTIPAVATPLGHYPRAVGTWSGGRRSGLLKSVRFVALWAVLLVGAYLSAGPIDRALSRLSGSLELFALVAAGACVVACWFLARGGFSRRDDAAQASAPGAESVGLPVTGIARIAAVAPTACPAAPSGEDTVTQDRTEAVDAAASTASEAGAGRRTGPARVVTDACRALDESAAEVGDVLGQFAETCLLLADRIEANRRQNKALAQWILQADRRSDAVS